MTHCAPRTEQNCRRWRCLLALATAGLLMAPVAKAQPPEPDQDGNVPPARFGAYAPPQKVGLAAVKEGELLVKFRQGATVLQRQQAHGRVGAEKIKEYPRLRLHHVKLKKGLTVSDAIARYRQDATVEYAEPNYRLTVNNLPNDPSFSQLWGMQAIAAQQAWDVTTGSPEVVVAVIDTGIDYTHPDLAANVWTNAGEIPNNGIDDDGNGYVDDVYGIDTYNHDSNPKDDHYHGTHVAGTIGAVGNNAVGVAGVAWNVRVLGCKFIGAGGYGYTDGAIACLDYLRTLKDRGVNIVASNNSWGGDGYSQALADTIADQGEILFVAAAGNDGQNNNRRHNYPSDYQLPNVVAVAATTQNNLFASFSNRGSRMVHLAAPGDNIYSLFPGGSYTSLSGTSMAAPHVSGVAALLKAQNPNRTAGAIRNLLLTGGDALTALANETITGKRLNAYGSLTCSGKPLFAAHGLPEQITAGTPATVAVTSVTCDLPQGPVSLTAADGSTAMLTDDGVAPDRVANDGIFTGAWTPLVSEPQILTIASPLGTLTVAAPAVTFSGSSLLSPPARFIAPELVSAPTGQPYRQVFTATGGAAPLTWSVSSGALPPGLTLNPATGELSGTPTTGDVYPLTILVTDKVGMHDWLNATLFFNEGLRPEAPVELQQRVGAGWLPASYAPIFDDLDNDGRQEMIAVDGNTLYVVRPGGQTSKVVLPGRLSAPATADLDGDGQKEIIVSAGYYYTNATPIYAYKANLTLLPGFPAGAYPTYYPNAPGNCRTPVVADLNSDGTPEIIVNCTPNNTNDQNYNKNVLLVVDNHGVMQPGWYKVIGVDTGEDQLPAVGDINGDGTLELVFVSRDGIIHTLRGDGTELAQWPVAPEFATTQGTAWTPVLADLNGDGILDIVVKYSLYVSGAPTTTRVAAFTGSGALLPGWPREFAGRVPSGLAVADLNDDGQPEIIFITGSFWNEVQAITTSGAALPGWPLLNAFGSGAMSSNPVIADIDGDGHQEVVVTGQNWAGGGLSKYGVKAFSASGTLLAGYPKYVTPGSEIRTTPAIGDLDGNGRLDLALKGEDGFLYLWEASQVGDLARATWPLYGQGPQHTNASKPELVISSPLPGLTNNNTPLLTYTQVGNVSVLVDGVAVLTRSGQQLPRLSEGDHTIEVLLTVAGQTVDLATVTITVDTLPPTIIISSPAAGASNDNTPLVSFTVSEGTPRVLVDNTVVNVSSGSSLGTLVDGWHTLRVEATDTVGNPAVASVDFNIDTVPPTIAINPVTTPTKLATQTISGKREANATVAVSANTTAQAGPVSYPTTTTWSCTVSGLVYGVNRLTATAKDAAGNSTAVSTSIKKSSK